MLNLISHSNIISISKKEKNGWERGRREGVRRRGK